MRNIWFFILMITTGFFHQVEAKVAIPKIFSENMVLQRETSIPVWGTANAGEKITVSLNKQSISVVADANGKWAVKLQPEEAATNLTLRISGENTIEIKNVAIGEVWLCSGQSNMEWSVAQSMNAAQELAAANNPEIRQIKIAKDISSTPLGDFKEGDWQVSSPQSARDFTAIGYFFARELNRELKVPVGIINASWGGTNIETWISRQGFESSDEFKEMIAKMPRLDLEKLTRSKVEGKVKQVELLQGAKLNSLNFEAFVSTDFDDSKLPTLDVPIQWEAQAFGEVDGVVWYRKIVNLTAAQARKSGALSIAKIDDNDVTYVNGIEVGKTNQWDARRIYPIAAGVLKEGRNTIVVKVVDTGGGGGIYGDASDVKLMLGDETVPLVGKWKVQVESVIAKTSENEFPSLAFNAMINPLVPYAFRGALWYQGESNAGRAFQYRKAFPLLIDDWRRLWKSDFPFYFVQLATFKTNGNSNEGSDWAELREAQTMTLSTPKTGMAVTTDVGDPKDIHPTNKQTVAKRLAAMAFNRIYKMQMVDSGPTFESLKVVGNKAIVSFKNVGRGLMTTIELGGGVMTTGTNGIVKGFEIAGSDRKFYAASAKIVGSTIEIASAKVAVPVAVRFGWIGDASACNLFNREGFPAVPFRTDDWKTITKDATYKIADIKP